MAFSSFKYKLFLRILFLTISIFGCIYLLKSDIGRLYFIGIFFFLALLLFQIFELFFYISKTNQKLTKFLDAIRYSDFTLKFSSDNDDKDFRALNNSFNEVLAAFGKERLEKEESLQYITTIVRHVSTGLLAYNKEGDIELINMTAKKYLGVNQIKNIEELISKNSKLYKAIFDIRSGKSSLYHGGEGVKIAINATSIKVKNNVVKLLALQNIYPELQKMEIESWQNLSKVLRHEIMNSVTPISSLNSTMLDILRDEITKDKDKVILSKDSFNDLLTGLSTVENRTKGLITFVEAYRNYTDIPKPKIVPFLLDNFLARISQLMKAELDKSSINFKCFVSSRDTIVQGDSELLEMVIINLIKNSVEANVDNKHTNIIVRGKKETDGKIVIEVIDNGKGIIPEALDKIFIPFYTTKKNGSGIGLSLSKQIMQMLNGTLTAQSIVGEETTFTIRI